ncbi:KamA family radical SAM protein [Streptomyces sp. NPDC059002]|uniref:KamA family radical SAM protein n=1 Tax=Streptomyces sp. NPDC059002 TaxID=3346690 RepID=UPI003696E9B2
MTEPRPGGDPVERFHAYGPGALDRLAARYPIPRETLESVRVVSLVLPFRVNRYVLDELIDWRAVPDDPMFRLVFPQPGMLDAAERGRLRKLAGLPGRRAELRAAVREIRERLNPHPDGQRELNVPAGADGAVPGVQHKYRETVLYFPGQGQTCHAYCSYCFRWAQFVGEPELRFAAPNPAGLIAYVRGKPEVTDVLITGGDPLVMSSARLRDHLEPLLSLDTVRTIRLGTKAVAYWPQRFTTDRDADDLLALFEQVTVGDRNLAVMAHYSHPRELDTPVARHALRRIRATGALVYCQAPLIAGVNDSAGTWARLWRAEAAAGAIPYYQFVARDTGPRDYFKVPLAAAVDIFRRAYRQLPGLARTVRGPVMSTTAGKVLVEGCEAHGGGHRLRLRFLQARDPCLVGRSFQAYDPGDAGWLDELAIAPDTPPDLRAATENAEQSAYDAVSAVAGGTR